MERIRFDGRPPSHPAAHDGLAARTITVGSASKELRLIGWRVGWVTGPAAILADIRLVGLTNVVCQVGLTQGAVAAALDAADADDDVAAATAQWQQRCDVVLRQLARYPVIAPHGGWSLLVDTGRRPLPADCLRQRASRTAGQPGRAVPRRHRLTGRRRVFSRNGQGAAVRG
jgi:aspartate/methionine/tyrosine aminotransferase